MSGIHDAVLTKVQSELTRMLITEIDEADVARVGVVKLGPLDGEPDPDLGRITVTLHENDPDRFVTGAPTEATTHWMDEVLQVEIGGGAATTWKRRFTLKARCLLESTKEGLVVARTIASTVRTRIEHALPKISFSGIVVDGETVVRRIVSNETMAEMIQSGGPPDSYDFLIKVRFDMWTVTAPVEM